MLNIVLQVITALCLMTGVITGETISNKVFGFSKKWYLNIIEVFLFITLLILLFNNFYITELDYIVVFTINFFFGVTAIMTTRGIISGAGFFSNKVKKKYTLSKEINEEVIIIGLIRNLMRKGIVKDEVRNVLENSGLNKNKVKRVIKKMKIKEEVYGTKGNSETSSVERNGS